MSKNSSTLRKSWIYFIKNLAFGNAVTSNEVIYKLRSIDERYSKNHGFDFKSGDIFLYIDIFLNLEETLMFS